MSGTRNPPPQARLSRGPRGRSASQSARPTRDSQGARGIAAFFQSYISIKNIFQKYIIPPPLVSGFTHSLEHPSGPSHLQSSLWLRHCLNRLSPRPLHARL